MLHIPAFLHNPATRHHASVAVISLSRVWHLTHTHRFRGHFNTALNMVEGRKRQIYKVGQALISCVQIIMNTFDYLCHFHFIIIDTKSFVLEMHVSLLILY